MALPPLEPFAQKQKRLHNGIDGWVPNKMLGRGRGNRLKILAWGGVWVCVLARKSGNTRLVARRSRFICCCYRNDTWRRRLVGTTRQQITQRTSSFVPTCVVRETDRWIRGRWRLHDPSPRETPVEDSSETEGARGATGVAQAEAVASPSRPTGSQDPEVPANPRRAQDRRQSTSQNRQKRTSARHLGKWVLF